MRNPLIRLAVAVGFLLATAHPIGAGEDRIRLIRDAEVEDTIRAFATPLFNAADLDPEAVNVYLINDNRLNAFVAGGMNIFVNTGLLMRSESPLQVMGVIAHETGHISGGHLARTQDALRAATIETIIAYVLGAAAAVATGQGEAAGAIISGGQNVALGSLLQYTRTQEAAADQAGMSYLERAGFSARGLLEFFEILQGEEVLLSQNQNPYIRTHPLTTDRVDSLRHFLSTSRFADAAPPADFVERHERMRAKLVGFLEPLPRVLQRYPESDQSLPARYARAIAYYRASDLAKAMPLVDALIGEHAHDPYFQELKGQILFENGRIAEAVPLYERSVELDPKSALLRMGLAQAQLELEQPELLRPALANLEEVVRREPRNSFAWRLLGIAYGRDGQLGMAALALAESALARGDRPEARYQAERAIRQLPENTPAWLRAQDILRAAKDEG